MYKRLMELCAERREIKHQHYETERARDDIVGQLRKGIKDIYGPSRDLSVFSYTHLAVPNARYLVIDWRGAHKGIQRADCMHVYDVHLLHNPEDLNQLWAFDAGTNSWLGRITPRSFGLDHLVPNTIRALDEWALWNPTMIPLEGKIMQHVMCQRLAAYAKTYLPAHNTDIIEIQHLETRRDALEKQLVMIHEQVQLLPYRVFEGVCNLLEANNAKLVAALDTMDWTYDYADRPSNASYEQERWIQAELGKLPLDDAVALFIRHSRSSWYYADAYLRMHPEVKGV